LHGEFNLSSYWPNKNTALCDAQNKTKFTQNTALHPTISTWHRKWSTLSSMVILNIEYGE
jgi:hypothetical protein